MRKSSASAFWGPWTPINVSVAPHVLCTVLDDGQAFRWHALADGSFVGVWGARLLRLRVGAGGVLEWSGPAALRERTPTELMTYLAAEMDWAALADRLPWRSDAHLCRSIKAFPGLFLLRQPAEETLLCFLCSANKRIVQIKRMVEAMAQRFGDALEGVEPTQSVPGMPAGLTLRRLPSFERLAEASEAELASCGLGYRTGNILASAKFLAANPSWLRHTLAQPYAEAHAGLMELPGVGPKIADCLLLYSGAHLQAFPVDTWIQKVMIRHYGLEGWSPEMIGHFGRVHFGEAAGLAQQYLFNWERQQGGAVEGLRNPA